MTEPPRPDRSPSSVLIVDDEQDFRHDLAAAFSNFSFVVYQAASYEESISVLADHRPDRALVDLRLPDRSGLWVLKRIRELSPPTRSILLTMYPSRPALRAALKFGAVGCIQKTRDVAHILHQFAAADRPALEPPEIAYHVPTLAEVEWEHINLVLNLTRGNLTQAAKLLGLERRTLCRKLQKHPPGEGSRSGGG